MIALYIILGIILFIAAIIVAVLSIRFTLYIDIVDKFALRLSWLFVKAKIYPGFSVVIDLPFYKKKLLPRERKEPVKADAPKDNAQSSAQTKPEETLPLESGSNDAKIETDSAGEAHTKKEEPDTVKTADDNQAKTKAAQTDIKPAQKPDSIGKTAQTDKSRITKKAKEKHDDKGFFTSLYELEGLPGIVEFLCVIASKTVGGFKKIIKCFVIRELYLYATVTGKDAAKTATNYGKICRAVFPPLGKICSSMRVIRYDVDISPDYLANKGESEFHTVVSVRPIRLVNAFIVLGVKLLIAFLRTKFALDKKKKAKNREDVHYERTVCVGNTGDSDR